MKQQNKIFVLVLLMLSAFTFPSVMQEKMINALSAEDSLDLKIGQMILMGIGDRKGLDSGDLLREEIRAGKLGGVVLFEKNIAKADPGNMLKRLISDMQGIAVLPLMISIDEEGGKVHRLKEKYGFVRMPSAAYLGQLNNPDTTYYYNYRLASQMKALGINLNFAPVLDLEINADNPVIAKPGRSFSKDAGIVSRHAQQCVRAHREAGVKTILKHFPGHGSSKNDSHLGIVDVSNTWNFSELFPYFEMMQSGYCDAVMTAHIINRNWDSAQLPATLSANVINGMLRGWMGFKGVVFSDDMQMNAISRYYGLENAIVLSVNAGVDVLMFGNNVNPDQPPATASEVHAAIKRLVKTGRIPEARINEAFGRIMLFKNGIR